MLLAIDPGNVYSAYCIMDRDYHFFLFDKIENHEMRKILIQHISDKDISDIVIEQIASYGMAVGREVFETCEWIGRFTEIAEGKIPVHYIYRRDEKLCICEDPRANDSTIRRALIDRFAKTDLKNGKGTKKNPDVFFGVKADMWAACAVAVTFRDMERYNTKR